MNKNNRTYRLITTSLDRLESAAAGPLTPDAAAQAAMDAVGLLDELRRLRRKWDEQAAEGNPRRLASDFRTHDAWVRQWRLAATKVLAAVRDEPTAAALRVAVASVAEPL